MDCNDVREQLLGHQRGRLDGELAAQIDAHLAGCEGCRQAAAVEARTSELLERQLPRHAAPADLKQRLAERVARPAPAAPAPRRRRAWVAPLASALAAAALVLVAVRVVQPGFLRPSLGIADLVDEGVNDHLRVVASSHPVEIESGGIHQVKPWFTGRLDFAPRVGFSGDGDFPLVGGAVGYFRDRKAAVFVFKRRLHTITLLVFPPEGLAWPNDGATRVGRLTVAEANVRGFSVLTWRDGGLGYALVSDVNARDLEALADRLNDDRAGAGN